jgi:hypothetical protein
MKTIKIHLPQTWNELNNRQLLRLSTLFHSGIKGKAFDQEVFLILMDVTGLSVKRALQAKEILAEVSLSELKTFYPFIYNEVGRTVFVKKMTVGKTELFSPADRLANLTAAEFAMADGLYFTWLKERHRRALEFLAAVLYTSGKGVRPLYNQDALEECALMFTEVPLDELLVMSTVYSGCRNYITSKFKDAFPTGLPSTSTQKSPGFGKVILQMAGGKFGTHKETGQTNLYTFLAEFQENLKEARKTA